MGAGGDRDDVRAVVSRYLTASAAGNGRQACAYLVPALRREMARMAHRGRLRGCPELLGTRIRYRVASLPVNLRSDVGDAFSDRGSPSTCPTAITRPRRSRCPTTPWMRLVRTADGWRIEKLA